MNTMKEKLTKAFQPEDIVITNESHKHIGHAGAASGGGHYLLKIKSSCFEGKNRVQIHRMIYKVLEDDMPSKIHALAIDATS